MILLVNIWRNDNTSATKEQYHNKYVPFSCVVWMSSGNSKHSNQFTTEDETLWM